MDNHKKFRFTAIIAGLSGCMMLSVLLFGCGGAEDSSDLGGFFTDTQVASSETTNGVYGGGGAPGGGNSGGSSGGTSGDGNGGSGDTSGGTGGENDGSSGTSGGTSGGGSDGSGGTSGGTGGENNGSGDTSGGGSDGSGGTSGGTSGGGNDGSGGTSDGSGSDGNTQDSTKTYLLAMDGNSCYIKPDKTLYCWGNGFNGQLGQGSTQSFGNTVDSMAMLKPVSFPTDRHPVQISGEDGTICAVLDDGQGMCWGSSFFGRLGNDASENIGDEANEMGDNLVSVTAINATLTNIHVGNNFSCGLTVAKQVICWGGNSDGQLGQGDKDRYYPRGTERTAAIDFGTDDNGKSFTVSQLALAGNSGCALIEQNRRVKCWGSNKQGELGLEDSNDRGDKAGEMGDNLPFVDLGPDDSGNLYEVQAIRGASQHFCAVLTNDAGVKCWGQNKRGQLGMGFLRSAGRYTNTMGGNLPLVELPNGVRVKDLQTSSYTTCILSTDSDVYCWGDPSYGALGQDYRGYLGDYPGEIASLNAIDLGSIDGQPYKASKLSVGDQHVCVELISDQIALKCWGRNDEGQLGLDSIVNQGQNANQMGDNLPLVSLP